MIEIIAEVFNTTPEIAQSLTDGCRLGIFLVLTFTSIIACLDL